MEVYLVYSIYQYDGLDEILVYGSREKAIEAADKDVQNFLGNGYEFLEGHENFSSFWHAMAGGYAAVSLCNDDGEVIVEVKKKMVQ